MSRVKHEAAFAVTSDGTLIMNVAHVGRRLSANQLLQWALGQPGKVLLGVQMSPAEVKRLLEWCNDIHGVAVAFVVGARQRRLKSGKGTKPRFE